MWDRGESSSTFSHGTIYGVSAFLESGVNGFIMQGERVQAVVCKFLGDLLLGVRRIRNGKFMGRFFVYGTRLHLLY